MIEKSAIDYLNPGKLIRVSYDVDSGKLSVQHCKNLAATVVETLLCTDFAISEYPSYTGLGLSCGRTFTD